MASLHTSDNHPVTVPVRGIRLHLVKKTTGNTLMSYCPREGYKVASGVKAAPQGALGYCPREGYKVASAKVHKCKLVTLA